MQLDLCLSCRFGQLVVCQCFVLDRHGLRREAGLAFRRPSIVCKSSGSCLVISYVVMNSILTAMSSVDRTHHVYPCAIFQSASPLTFVLHLPCTLTGCDTAGGPEQVSTV